MKPFTIMSALHLIAALTCAALLPSCIFMHEGKPINESRTIELPAEVTTASIKTVAANIRLSQTSGDEVRVSLTGTSNSDKILFQVETNGNRLEIECDEQWTISSDLTMLIEIPKRIFSQFDVKTVSGEIKSDGVEAVSATFKSTSGEIDISNLTTTGSALFKNTSGKISVSTLTAGSALFENTSGRMNVSDLTTGSAAFESISGKINAKTVKGVVNAKTTSGDIDISYIDQAYETKAKTVSGSITVGIPDGSSFTFDMDSTSGGKKCDFAAGNSGMVNGGGPEITLETTSGFLLIQKL